MAKDAPRPLWLDKISFEELCRGGYIHPTGRFQYSLGRYHVHPLFYQRQWPNISDHDYQLLIPSLHLATKLLVSPRFLPFWYALLHYRTGIRSYGLQGMYGRICDRFDLGDGPLTAAEEKEVGDRFWQLANCHRFQFDTEDRLGDADATTDVIDAPGFPDRPHSHASNSRISDKYLRLLSQYKAWPAPEPKGVPETDGWPTTASISRTAFHLAKNLVHELCHAFNNALIAYSPRSRVAEIQIKIEPFFMDQRRCELGRAWESYVFGGHVDGVGDGLNMQFGISVTKWPHPFSQEGQQRAPSRRSFKSSYAIPMAWLDALWTEDFWSQIDANDDYKIPRILGVRTTSTFQWNSDEEELEFFSDTDDSEMAGLANDERAEAVEKRMRVRVRERLNLEYSDSEDSSVARYADRSGVVRN